MYVNKFKIVTLYLNFAFYIKRGMLFCLGINLMVKNYSCVLLNR